MESRAFGLNGSVAIPTIWKPAERANQALSDEEIVTLVCGGDSEAFGILVKKYEDFVYTLVRGIVACDETAKDIAQETFLRAYRSIRRFEGKAAFKTWLYRIAYNTSMNHIKKRQANENLTEEMVDNLQFDKPVPSPSALFVRKLIDRLKPEHRAIIILHYYEDLKYEEMAEVLNCPLGTVKIRLYRAKYELKMLWGKYAV
jgi:RNA polymerase sigma-70 factor (ECF subfamily)